MTGHLSPEEFTDALDASLSTQRMAHLDTCEACRKELHLSRSALGTLRASDAETDPSSFVMKRLNDRIREATRSEPATRRAWWRPAAAFAALAATVALVAVLRSPNPVARPNSEAARVSSSLDRGSLPDSGVAAEEGEWQFVADVTATLSTDDLRHIVTPSPNSPLIDSLSADERQAFVRLVQVEMGGLE